MNKLLISISSIYRAVINSIARIITLSENALQTQYRIKPIIKENLGVLNGLILGSGIITILLFSIDSINADPLILSIELTLCSLLLLFSIWITNNHYIHTLITIYSSVLMFRWLSVISVNWANIIYIIALMIILLFVLYFDLLKKNIVLQFVALALVILLFNFGDKTMLLKPELDSFLYGTKPELMDNIFNILLKQFLLLPIIFLVLQVSKLTNRIAFYKIVNPVFHILTISYTIALILLSPVWLSVLVLIFVLVIAFIMALRNRYNISFAYLMIFLVTSMVLILNNSSLGNILSSNIILIIFPLITFLTIIGKSFIDSGSMTNNN